MTITSDLEKILQNTFGFKSFRPGQREGIETLLTSRALLSIQPTGQGKSLLYQLPTLLLPGMTLVVSPLLALMRDQERHLNHRFGIAAAAINSDQEESVNDQVRLQALAGELKVLFIAPEQLDHVERFEFLRHLPISLFVIDEAHCVSTWGHDFRPSYRQILKLVDSLVQRSNDLHVLALTATADHKVEEDIIAQISAVGRQVSVQRNSMNRPNIALHVMQVQGLPAKLDAAVQLMRQLPRGGLVYCATRENVEIVTEHFQALGISAEGYHAGMSAECKRKLQEELLCDKYAVLCATNALGMGIDKQNLRYIIHFDIPGSITAYYQEVGRCGRDGQPAYGILLYDPADKKIQEYFIHSAQPTPEDFELIQCCVRNAPQPLGLTAIKHASGLHPTRVIVVVAELVEQGFFRKTIQEKKQVYLWNNPSGALKLDRYINQYAVRIRELDAMFAYAQGTHGCRMATLRRALGDKEPQPCESCDCCTVSLVNIKDDPKHLLSIDAWLAKRPIPTPPMSRLNVLPGHALLNGKLRSQAFIHFMQRRACSSAADFGLPDEVIQLLLAHLETLKDSHKWGCVVHLPSRTWGARAAIAEWIAMHLGVPSLPGLLGWREMPPARQGELLNNDQRRENVAGRMSVLEPLTVAKGTILLLDDYFGSGATLREGCRALRMDGRIKLPIMPLTLAAVQWRLGRRGMI